jgi:hypothetical protein
MTFPVGQVLATPGALELLQEVGVRPESLLQRHLNRDWGDLSPEDVAENEFSLREGFRLLSAYRVRGDEKVWVITEADRTSTTLLLPSEY